VELIQLQAIDISALCVHPACVVSITLTCLRTESCAGNKREQAESLIVNVSGRLLLVQQVCASPDAESGSTTLVIIWFAFYSKQLLIYQFAVCSHCFSLMCRKCVDAAEESKRQASLDRGIVALLRSTRDEGVAASVSKRWRQGSHVYVQEDNASIPTENLPSWYIQSFFLVSTCGLFFV
jgi:hypothetical protein